MNFRFNSATIEVAKKIAQLGGRLFLVGGAVRDLFMDRPSHDHDYVVTGLTTTNFEKVFNNPLKTGNLFPVYRLQIGNEECEVAFARKEIKTGEGHNGFTMVFDPSITIEEDLIRRDVTINSIAMEVLTGNIIDPFNGVEDINKGIMRATSTHFVEDPLRVLRVARQASVFGFDVDDKTLRLMETCADELTQVPNERVWGELEKALKAERPSKFFRILAKSNTLRCNFPEIEALIGQEQSAQWHPEGDAFEHSMLVLDKVASMTEDVEARFCALYHDIGKGLTAKEELPHHYLHEVRGADLIASWQDGRFPSRFKSSAEVVARHHMKALILNEMTPKKVFSLLDSLRKGKCHKAFRQVVFADSGLTFKALSDETFTKVFSKVEIPEKVLQKDGKQIGEFVRQVRIERVRQILAE